MELGVRRCATPVSMSVAIIARHAETTRRIGFGSRCASSVSPSGVVSAHPPITQRSDRQSIWRHTLGRRFTEVRSSMQKKAGITCAGGSTMVSEPMPISAEPKPDRPRTMNATSVDRPIQASVGESKPSVTAPPGIA